MATIHYPWQVDMSACMEYDIIKPMIHATYTHVTVVRLDSLLATNESNLTRVTVIAR